MQVTYPKRTDKPLYHGLVKQLESLNIPFLPPEQVTEGAPLHERYEVIIDAIFGFSFHGSPRPPFDTIVQVHGLPINTISAAMCSVPLLDPGLIALDGRDAWLQGHLQHRISDKWCLPLVTSGWAPSGVMGRQPQRSA